MKVTEDQIRVWINEYKREGYYDAASKRCWDNMYIHAPKSKSYINGVPSCAVWKKLVKETFLESQSLADFDKLYRRLVKLKREKNVKGIGELLIYDTATCLGARPTKIYIHAGVIDGLAALRGVEKGEIRDHSPIELDMFFEEFPVFKDSELQAIHIEDFLCIYHHDLNNNSNRGRRNRNYVRNNYRTCACCCK